MKPLLLVAVQARRSSHMGDLEDENRGIGTWPEERLKLLIRSPGVRGVLLGAIEYVEALESVGSAGAVQTLVIPSGR